MPKNIEMNVLNESGSYDVLHPETQSDITLNSTFLKNLWNLEDNSSVDDAFNYVDRQLILIQYNKAGVNVTLTSAGGAPLEGFKINGITVNYDGTGDCYTDSQGKCFGYCDAGSVTVGSDNFTDITFNSQQISAIATQMYNVNLVGSIASNFMKFTSSTSVIFSPNVQQIDVTCVGGGGGGGSSDMYLNYYAGSTGGGGAGGYCEINENVSFTSSTSYQVIVGSGGVAGNNSDGGNGGVSSFLGISANGGGGGGKGEFNHSSWVVDIGQGGKGNGNGGRGAYKNYQGAGVSSGSSGGNGTIAGYSSFTETVIYGGGGGSGGFDFTGRVVSYGGNGGSYGGNGGSSLSDLTSGGNQYYAYNGTAGSGGFGGGGGSGGLCTYFNRDWDSLYKYGNPAAGGSGCVAIRLHYKVIS